MDCRRYRIARLALALAEALLCVGAAAGADGYPSRAITLVTPYPAGGIAQVAPLL